MRDRIQSELKSERLYPNQSKLVEVDRIGLLKPRTFITVLSWKCSLRVEKLFRIIAMPVLKCYRLLLILSSI